MTAPRPVLDPHLLSRLSDEFSSLGGQLARLGGDIATLRGQVEAASAAPVPQMPPPAPKPQPTPPQRIPQPAGPPPGWAPPQPGFAPPPPRVRPQPPQPAPAGRWQPQPAPREPWWQRDGVISRLLAVAGAAVTLIGVVMLLVLAAQAGIFGPSLRVATGAGLSVVLIAVGARVFGRSGGRVGGIALAATGLAGLYLDVVAVTVIYKWLDAPIGLVLALAVTATGIALATRWQAQSLALLVVLGSAVLAPVVTGGITLSLIGFLLVLQFGCAGVQWLREWPGLHIARTAPIVLALLLAIGESAFDSGTDDHRRLLLAACVAAAVIGVGSSLAAAYRNRADVVGGSMLGVALLPLLGSSALFERPMVAIIQGSTAVALLALAAVPKLSVHTRIAAVGAGAIATMQACFVVTGYETHAIALFVVAAAFVAASEPMRSRGAYVVGLVFAAVGAVTLADVAGLDALADVDIAVRQLGVGSAVGAVLGVAVVALLLRQALRLGVLHTSSSDAAWVPAGLAALYATTVAAVSLGVTAGGAGGFTIGHCTATLVWMIAAAALLLYGLRSGANAQLALVCGLTLTAAAVAKLFLFDLATLDGLTRVVAFIGVGLTLLAVGTRYARAFAERGADNPERINGDSGASAVR